MTEGMTRRTILKRGGAGIAGAALPISILCPAWASPEAMEALVGELVGGRPVTQEGLTIETPIIAENGAKVPVTLTTESPMSEADHIRAIYLYAPENPAPQVAGFRFTPQSGKARVTIQIRLAKSQTIVALADASDGSFRRTEMPVKVTVGGCGG